MADWNIPGANYRQVAKSKGRANTQDAIGGVAPMTGTILGVDTQAETLRVAAAPNDKGLPSPILQPFLSLNSWHRAVPEAGVGVLVQKKGDTNRYIVSGYNQRDTSATIAQYMAGNGIYRPLQPGEQDMFSSGAAGMFLSKFGVMELRGGMVYGELNHGKMEHWMKAAVHRRLLHLNKETELGDEERFGIVYRPALPDYGYEPVKSGDYFAKEYYRCLKTNATPEILCRVREGNVYEESAEAGAKEEKQTITSKNLRLLAEYFNKAGDGSVRMEIDEEGNVAFSTPASATDGINVQVPKGDIKIDVTDSKKNFELTTGQDTKITASAQIVTSSTKDTSMTSAANFKVKADKDVNIESTLKTLIKASDAMNIESTAKMSIKSSAALSMESSAAMNIKAGAAMNAESTAPMTLKAPKVTVDAPMVEIGSGGAPGLVVTTITHPVDFVTGLPIMGTALVKAASVPSVG